MAFLFLLVVYLADLRKGTLTLKNLTMDMSGTYICSASSNAGSANCTINLKVSPSEWPLGPARFHSAWLPSWVGALRRREVNGHSAIPPACYLHPALPFHQLTLPEKKMCPICVERSASFTFLLFSFHCSCSVFISAVTYFDCMWVWSMFLIGSWHSPGSLRGNQWLFPELTSLIFCWERFPIFSAFTWKMFTNGQDAVQNEKHGWNHS